MIGGIPCYRLGVGVNVPDAAGPSGRETAQLKNKLTGKKRPRDVDADSHDATVNGTTKGSKKDDESDEEESRASAIRKKAKVDPFEKKAKKKKGKGQEAGRMVNGKEDDTANSVYAKVKGKEKGKEGDGNGVAQMFEVPSFGVGASASGRGEDEMVVDDHGRKDVTDNVLGDVESRGNGENMGEDKKKKKKRRKKGHASEAAGKEQDEKDGTASISLLTSSPASAAVPLTVGNPGLSFSFVSWKTTLTDVVVHCLRHSSSTQVAAESNQASIIQHHAFLTI